MARPIGSLLAVAALTACTPEPAPPTSSPTVSQVAGATASRGASQRTTAGSAGARAAAEKLTMPACGLKVSMSAATQCSESVEDAPSGPIQGHACRATVSTSPLVVFVAGCSDYPADYVERVQDPDGLLRAALQGEVKSSGGTQRGVAPVATNGVTGKEAVIDIGDALMVTRVYLAGRRIFHFAVVAPGGIAEEKAPAFFRSIELPSVPLSPRPPPQGWRSLVRAT